MCRGRFCPEVNHHLFSFLDVQDNFVAPAPVRKEFHFLPVSVLLIVPDHPYHCCVVCVFNDVVCDGLSTAVSDGLYSLPQPFSVSVLMKVALDFLSMGSFSQSGLTFADLRAVTSPHL